jgi:hypothetical protein
LLHMWRRLGESAVVCQGRTWHRMLRTGGFPWTRASKLVWCAVNARGSKPEICLGVTLWEKIGANITLHAVYWF